MKGKIKQREAEGLCLSDFPKDFHSSIGLFDEVATRMGLETRIKNEIEDYYTSLIRERGYFFPLYSFSGGKTFLCSACGGHIKYSEWTSNENRKPVCPKCGHRGPVHNLYDEDLNFVANVVWEASPEKGYSVIRSFSLRVVYEFSQEEADEPEKINIGEKKPKITCMGWADSFFAPGFGFLPSWMYKLRDELRFSTRSEYSKFARRTTLVKPSHNEYMRAVDFTLGKDAHMFYNRNLDVLAGFLGMKSRDPKKIMKAICKESTRILNEDRIRKKDNAADYERRYRDSINFPGKEAMFGLLGDTLGHKLAGYTDRTQGKTFYTCSCGAVFEKENKNSKKGSPHYAEEAVMCPECRTKYPNSGISSCLVGHQFVNLGWDTVGVLFYSYRFGYEWPGEEDEMHPYNRLETGVMILQPGKMLFFNADENLRNWVKCSAANFDFIYYRGNSDQCVNSREELLDVVKNSFLSRMGVPEAWEQSEEYPGGFRNSAGAVNKGSYLYSVMRLPLIEKTFKAGLRSLTSELIRTPSEAKKLADMRAKKLTDVFSVSSSVLKIIKESDMKVEDILNVKILADADSSYNLETHKRLQSLAVMGRTNPDMSVIGTVTNIASRFHIGVSHICEYLEDCYMDQCIPVGEAAIIWRDWLTMAEILKYNFRNMSDRMPRSLKKEHDRAVFACNAIQEKLLKEKFDEASRENRKYEFEKGKYQVVVPMTPEEVIAEGVAQKHCVGTYICSIREGMSVIVFIRRKECPDKSFFTVEICGSNITQCKGFGNHLPDDESLIGFVRDFAKAKKLNIVSRDLPDSF